MKKKAPPYARQTRIPANNPTAYVFIDWFSWQQANRITRARGMIYLPNEDPAASEWAVRGCGVIIMDYLGTVDIGPLTTELLRSGAEVVHHVDFTNETTNKNVG